MTLQIDPLKGFPILPFNSPPFDAHLIFMESLMALEIKAHITGTVWKIEVEVGEEVEEEDELVILESMKMEMPVETPVDGTVKEILIKEGEAVTEGQVMFIVEAD